ncbi:hypothetical protein HPP92_007185 [Vanilla planifolia]|uniref:Uncharacterized protein n=1 Tax=Vanilla planifolia TaxID=51239 RepID=A0A835RC67_VANPL|nr:hypothetical protein HPP92_007185 [Vanilla planifolia]
MVSSYSTEADRVPGFQDQIFLNHAPGKELPTYHHWDGGSDQVEGFNLRELFLTRLIDIDKILNIAIRDRRAISSRPLLSVWIGIKEDSMGLTGKEVAGGSYPLSFLSSQRGAGLLHRVRRGTDEPVFVPLRGNSQKDVDWGLVA